MSKCHAILLAAGGSSRLGRAKQLLQFEGQALVKRAADLLCEVADNVCVVTGADAGPVSECVKRPGLTCVHNSRWREGVGSSIALAMDTVPDDAAGALIMLCDQYRLKVPDLELLISAWREDPTRITSARWAESFGPPVVFPARFFTALKRLQGDRGARRLLVEERTRVNFIDLPDASYDLDDANDLKALRQFERVKGSA